MSAISHSKVRTRKRFKKKSLFGAQAHSGGFDNTTTMIVVQKLDEYILILGEIFEEFTREPYGYRGRHTPHMPA